MDAPFSRQTRQWQGRCVKNDEKCDRQGGVTKTKKVYFRVKPEYISTTRGCQRQGGGVHLACQVTHMVSPGEGVGRASWTKQSQSTRGHYRIHLEEWNKSWNGSRFVTYLQLFGWFFWTIKCLGVRTGAKVVLWASLVPHLSSGGWIPRSRIAWTGEPTHRWKGGEIMGAGACICLGNADRHPSLSLLKQFWYEAQIKSTAATKEDFNCRPQGQIYAVLLWRTARK